jgi:hypothetical protein
VSTALEHRGMTDWHLFYIALDATTLEDPMWQKLLWSTFYTALPRMEQFLGVYAKLFPEAPMDALRERYRTTRDFAVSHGPALTWARLAFVDRARERVASESAFTGFRPAGARRGSTSCTRTGRRST